MNMSQPVIMYCLLVVSIMIFMLRYLKNKNVNSENEAVLLVVSVLKNIIAYSENIVYVDSENSTL